MILNSTVMGEGEPLVLLHGLFGAARNLGMLSRTLSANAKVVALDLRNHGESPRGWGMEFPTMAADVAETMAALGIARANVAGHSMGGKTAMALALTRPELVARLAVLDIAPIPYNHNYDDYVKAMLAVDLAPGLTRGAADAALAGAVKEAPMRAFLLNNLVLGDAPRWRVGLKEIEAALPGMLNWVDPEGARPFTGPSLFLRGAESHYVPDSAFGKIGALFPHARIETVEGAAHWLHADRPAEVATALRGFFAS